MPQTRHRPVFCLKTLSPHWNCLEPRDGQYCIFAGAAPLPCSVRCGPYRHLCRTGWRPTRRPMPTPSCWSSTLRCRISPVPPNDTTATLSLSLPRAAESLNCSCCVWTRHLCGCQPCRRAQRSAVQCNTGSALVLPQCSGLQRCTCRRTGQSLGLYCLPNISTRYRDREASVQAVSDALARLVQARMGNYFAFFPKLRISAAGTRRFCSTLPGHSHPCAGKPSG